MNRDRGGGGAAAAAAGEEEKSADGDGCILENRLQQGGHCDAYPFG
jgi:hypothetical protein